MPWFPDFVAATELSRRDSRTVGRTDPVTQYLHAIEEGESKTLQSIWPGEIVIEDPRAGTIKDRRELRRFVRDNRARFTKLHATTEIIASTSVGRRAVVEILAHLDDKGQEIRWPIAVVAESPDDDSVRFRTYCSQWPVDGRRHVRPPILPAMDEQPKDVVGRHLKALAAGEVEAVVATFGEEGYVREPIGPHLSHQGLDAVRSFFAELFSYGGGIELEGTCITDDGTRCAFEYNFVHWGSHAVPPQAGLAVFERGPDGLLSAVRIYDDVEPPA
ncbi:MAG TPA: nuclear transport factor 2 family protein [Acidimicrobiales bacterium]